MKRIIENLVFSALIKLIYHIFLIMANIINMLIKFI